MLLYVARALHEELYSSSSTPFCSLTFVCGMQDDLHLCLVFVVAAQCCFFRLPHLFCGSSNCRGRARKGASGMSMILQALKSSVLTQAVSLAEPADEDMPALEPLTLTGEQMQPLDFDAMVGGEVLGIPQGTKVGVHLDLFGRPLVGINGDCFDVHLRIGSHAR
jgi:hypothetical protein